MDVLSPEKNTAVSIITLTVVCQIPTTWMSSRSSAVEIAKPLMLALIMLITRKLA